MRKPASSSLLLALIACVTLGLAPYLPEPHVIGKIRWVIGGAHGMTVIDWLDLAMHGAPWLVLVALLLLRLRQGGGRTAK